MAKKFCTSCGAPLGETTRVCPQCGAQGNLPPQPAPADPPVAAPPTTAQAQAPQDTYAPQSQAPVVPAPASPPVQARPQPARNAQPVYEQRPQPAPAQAATPDDGRYDIISTGGFIGILLLIAIPIVGLVLLIVWACGGCKKQVKRNFARASLILTAIALVLGLITTLLLRFFAPDLLSDMMDISGLGSGSSYFSSDLLASNQQQEDGIMTLNELASFSDSANDEADTGLLSQQAEPSDPAQSQDDTDADTSSGLDMEELEDVDPGVLNELSALEGLDLSALEGLDLSVLSELAALAGQ